MKRWIAVVAALALPSLAVAQIKPAELAARPSASLPLGTDLKVRPIALTRIKAEFGDNQSVGTVWGGALCVIPTPMSWKDIASHFTDLADVFGEEVKQAGFKSDKDPADLFADRESSDTDLQLGALLKGVELSGCDDAVHTSSKMTLTIEWQVYSTVKRQVVARVETHAQAGQTRTILGGKPHNRSLAQAAFAANVQALLADPAFRAVVIAAPDKVRTAAETTAGMSNLVAPNSRGGAVSIAEAANSVVAVFAGSGFGSGVLVSDDGYILTNQHVVGASDSVRVRWADGAEDVATVVRSDKGRDVALIKAPPHRRVPLRLQFEPPQVGASVYAIGTPLDPKLQNTVTRGIVSGRRTIDGFSFIQSDTPITHGNSGGPLIDETGAVVGLSDLGTDPEAGSSLNFFIPIAEAFDYLALRPAAPSRPSPVAKAAHKKS
jgi:serine protease Do